MVYRLLKLIRFENEESARQITIAACEFEKNLELEFRALELNITLYYVCIHV